MITFEQVTKKFPNGTIAFHGLSFVIDEGGMLLITGPSGSGKTTIMRLLIREYQPSAGSILFEGNKLTDLPGGKVPEHRQKIGVVFQDYKLIEELNVWENIALPLDIKGRKIDEIESRVTDLLKLVGLTDKALMFPKQLSGGEAQRVAIARALATGPRLIFADEPTGNLDAKTGQRIIALLKKINQLGTTLLVATHDPKVIEQLDINQIDLDKFQTQDEQLSETNSHKKDQPKNKKKTERTQDKKQPQAKEIALKTKDGHKLDKKKSKDENQEQEEKSSLATDQKQTGSNQKQAKEEADKTNEGDQQGRVKVRTGIATFLQQLFKKKKKKIVEPRDKEKSENKKAASQKQAATDKKEDHKKQKTQEKK